MLASTDSVATAGFRMIFGVWITFNPPSNPFFDPKNLPFSIDHPLWRRGGLLHCYTKNRALRSKNLIMSRDIMTSSSDC
jgi:hypothetical protein